MIGRNFFFHWYSQNTVVESRPLTISPTESGYEREQLVWNVIELFKDIDVRLLELNIDRYLILKLKFNNEWIVIPASVRNFEQFLLTFKVDANNIIEGSLQFVDQLEIKYIVNEFSSQLIDAAALSDTVYYNNSDLSPTPLEVPLDKSNELSSFDVIFRSEHYLEFTRGVKYFVAHKDNRLYIAFRGSASMQNWFDNANLISDSFESQGFVHRGFYELTKCINIDYLYSLLEKKMYDQIILCGHSLGGAVAKLITAQLLSKQQEHDRKSLQPLQLTNRQLLCFSFGSPGIGDANFCAHFCTNMQLHDSSIFSSSDSTCPIPSRSHLPNAFFTNHFVNIIHEYDIVPRVMRITRAARNRLIGNTKFKRYEGVFTTLIAYAKHHVFADFLINGISLVFPRGNTFHPDVFLHDPFYHDKIDINIILDAGNIDWHSIKQYQKTCIDFVRAYKLRDITTGTVIPLLSAVAGTAATTTTSVPVTTTETTTSSNESTPVNSMRLSVSKEKGINLFSTLTAATCSVSASLLSASSPPPVPVITTTTSTNIHERVNSFGNSAVLQEGLKDAALLNTSTTTMMTPTSSGFKDFTITTTGVTVTTDSRLQDIRSSLSEHLLGLMMIEDTNCELIVDTPEHHASMTYLRSCGIVGKDVAIQPHGLHPFIAIHPITKMFYPMNRLLAIFLASCSTRTTTCPYDLFLVIKVIFSSKHHYEQALFYPFIPAVLHLFPLDSPWLLQLVKLVKPVIPMSIPFNVAHIAYPLFKQGKLLVKIIRNNSIRSLWQHWRKAYVIVEKGFLLYYSLDAYDRKGIRLLSVQYMKGFVFNENPDKLKFYLMQEEKQLIFKLFPNSGTMEEYNVWKNIIQQHLALFPTPRSIAMSTGEEIIF